MHDHHHHHDDLPLPPIGQKGEFSAVADGVPLKELMQGLREEAMRSVSHRALGTANAIAAAIRYRDTPKIVVKIDGRDRGFILVDTKEDGTRTYLSEDGDGTTIQRGPAVEGKSTVLVGWDVQ